MSTYRPNPKSLTPSEQAVEVALPGWKVVRSVPDEYVDVSPHVFTRSERIVAEQMSNAVVVRRNPEYIRYLQESSGSSFGSGATHVDAISPDVSALRRKYGVDDHVHRHVPTLKPAKEEVCVRMARGSGYTIQRVYVQDGKVVSYQG